MWCTNKTGILKFGIKVTHGVKDKCSKGLCECVEIRILYENRGWKVCLMYEGGFRNVTDRELTARRNV